MVGLIFSAIAFAAALCSARRSVGAGMAVVLASGYFYGIVRARYLDGFSHFIFDAAVFGVYLGHFSRVKWLKRPPHADKLYVWTILLVGWPVAVFSMGMLYPQHPLIQLVGLRAAIWFLPFLLVGAWAHEADLIRIARALAVLNVAVLVFGIAEYFAGVPAFYPENAVTEIIYRSKDVAGYSAHRIPATFSSSAAYGGTMVASLPLLVGCWLVRRTGLNDKTLMVGGIVAAAFGVFLCASRSPVVILFAMGFIVAWQLRGRAGYLLAAALIAGIVAYVVTGNERLQRFTSLHDSEYVVGRLAGSANLGVLDTLADYPLGAGLGSAVGTSVPGFLSHLAPEPIGAENEYARIGLERGMVGLFLWLAFLVWLFTRSRLPLPLGWKTGGTLMWFYAAVMWATAFIGCGMLTSIPTTSMLLFQMGVIGRSRWPGKPTFCPSGTPSAGQLARPDRRPLDVRQRKLTGAARG